MKSIDDMVVCKAINLRQVGSCLSAIARKYWKKKNATLILYYVLKNFADRLSYIPL